MAKGQNIRYHLLALAVVAVWGVTFVLNPVETARLHAFVARHRGHVRSGSAGEWLRVYFTPTGLGTISEVRCLSCRETEDLTDYDQW